MKRCTQGRAVQIGACIGCSLSKELQPVLRSIHLFTRVQRAPALILKGFIESPIFSFSLEIIRNALTIGIFRRLAVIFAKIYATHLSSRICQDESRYAGRPCIFQCTRLCTNGGRESRGKLCGARSKFYTLCPLFPVGAAFN